MASWVLRQAPWTPYIRIGLRLDVFAWSARHNILSKTYFSTPLLSQETPAMLELKKHPYPSASLDTSVFEEVSEEYGYGDLVLPATRAKDPCALLVELVKNEKYRDAEQVYSELAEMGVKIKTSATYGHMALHVLQTAYESPHARLEAFTRWWLLTPSLLDKEHTDYSGVTDTLMHKEPSPDIPLITRFALISATKGFAYFVGVRAVSLIVRYAEPSASSTFLDTFYRSAYAWHLSLPADASSGPFEQFTERSQSWYAFAIRQHCMSGRMGEAVEVLKAAVGHDVAVSSFTYRFLRGKLVQARDFATLATVDELLGRPSKPASGSLSEQQELGPNGSLRYTREKPSTHAPADADGLNMDDQSQRPTRSLLTPWTIYTPHTLALALRALRHRITNNSYPRPRVLARFLDAYHRTKRTRAAGILRARSYAHGYQTASIWALAEMIMHLRRREFRQVLLAFAHHFHLVGVPRWLLQHLPSIEEIIKGEPKRYGKRLEPILPLRQKLWPSSHHTALVWRAAAEFHKYHQDALENLYADFLEQLQRSLASRSSPSTLPSESPAASPTLIADEYPQAIPPPATFDTAHFNSFIYMFARQPQLGAPRAARVIVDMYAHGFVPDQDSLASLGAAFARSGQADQLEGLLARMDEPEAVATSEGTDARWRSGRRAGEAGAQKPPVPTVAVYTAIIRAFVQTRRFERAVYYVEEMRRRTRYRARTNPLTDSAIAEAEYGVATGQERPEHTAPSAPNRKPQWLDVKRSGQNAS